MDTVDQKAEYKSLSNFVWNLDSDDERLRDYAVKSLVRIGKPAVEFLIELLKEDPRGVQSYARKKGIFWTNMLDLNDPWGLWDRTRRNYKQVLWILGEIGDYEAIKPLTAVLKEKLESIREEEWIKAAVHALGKIGGAEILVELLKDGTNRANPVFRKEAVGLLLNIGDVAVDPLIMAIRDNINFTSEAGEILRKIGKSATERLIIALRDMDNNVRKLAARILGEFKDIRSVEPLIVALKEDTDNNVRGQAAWALGEIKDIRSVEPLILALKEDTDNNVRKLAARILGEFKDIRSVEPLIVALKEDIALSVKSPVARALEKMGWKPSNQEEKINFLAALGRVKQLAAIGKPAVQALLRLRGDSELSKDVSLALLEIGTEPYKVYRTSHYRSPYANVSGMDFADNPIKPSAYAELHKCLVCGNQTGGKIEGDLSWLCTLGIVCTHCLTVFVEPFED